MPDNPSKLQNIQLPAKSGDSLRTGVVEADTSAGGDGKSGLVPSAAKEGVERRACDCEYWPRWTELDTCTYMVACAFRNSGNLSQDCYCRAAEGDLP